MLFYLSHKIRGSSSHNATNVEQEKNCAEAIKIGKQIRKALSTIELYIPGEQTEKFVNIAYKKGYLNEKQILDVDCAIIDNCEGVIMYVPKGDKIQGGRLIEYNHTKHTGKPVFVFADVQNAIKYLVSYVIMEA